MNKRFDCVEMKHRAARNVQRKTRTLSRASEIKYWKNQTDYLRRFQSGEVPAFPSFSMNDSFGAVRSKSSPMDWKEARRQTREERVLRHQER